MGVFSTMKYFVELDKFNLEEPIEEVPDTERDYKKEYYALIRELGKLYNTMKQRCPIVRSCCGGCNLLKMKITDLKRKDGNKRHTKSI